MSIILWIILILTAIVVVPMAFMMLVAYIALKFKLKMVEKASQRQMLYMQQVFRPDLNNERDRHL